MKLLIFDLDGTLIDSKLDLAHAVNAARTHMGRPALPFYLIYSYVGNGAPVLMRRAMGPEASDVDVKQALEFFLAYYHDHMLDHTTLYPGVAETLNTLLEAGKQMAILTNKPVRISKAIIEGLGLSKHFFQIYGGNSFDQKKPHPIGIETLIRESGIAGASALMIGDSAVDIQTARHAHIKACGVTYGFQPESLDAEAPDFIIHSFDELTAITSV